MVSEPKYRYFDHTADIGVEVYGHDAASLFANAGEALFDALLEMEPGEIAPENVRDTFIQVQGDDWADLMINWLKELLYLFNERQQVLVHTRIGSLSEHALVAVAATRDFQPGRDRAGQEIKAVTYHQIQAGPDGDRWRARVILDV
jgi:SHS2 domain-containing protein